MACMACYNTNLSMIFLFIFVHYTCAYKVWSLGLFMIFGYSAYNACSDLLCVFCIVRIYIQVNKSKPWCIIQMFLVCTFSCFLTDGYTFLSRYWSDVWFFSCMSLCSILYPPFKRGNYIATVLHITVACVHKHSCKLPPLSGKQFVLTWVRDSNLL
jgi:hypothetical protein